MLFVSACGSSSSGSNSATSSSSQAPAGETTAQAGGTTLAADAKSAATGDIPDTQHFLTLTAPRARVSMIYPEGWTVQESPSLVAITDKNNRVRIAVSSGATPSVASVRATMTALALQTPGLHAGATTSIVLKSGTAVKVPYSTLSAPNPVTGKQVTLKVDRYVLAHSGRVAVVDLGTPVGVDNVDAYRRMIESFRWR